MGDSITELWTDVPGVNAGVTGQSTDQMLARFDRDVLSRNPSVVVILGGTNDVYASDMPSTASVDRMADMAAAAKACVILGTLPPVFVAVDLDHIQSLQLAWNAEIKAIANAHGYLVADYRPPMEGRPELFADGVHPRAAGYEIMHSVVVPLIEECQRR